MMMVMLNCQNLNFYCLTSKWHCFCNFCERVIILFYLIKIIYFFKVNVYFEIDTKKLGTQQKKARNM